MLEWGGAGVRVMHVHARARAFRAGAAAAKHAPWRLVHRPAQSARQHLVRVQRELPVPRIHALAVGHDASGVEGGLRLEVLYRLGARHAEKRERAEKGGGAHPPHQLRACVLIN